MKDIPHDLVIFLITTLFSLLIGMEQHRFHLKKKSLSQIFGTDRTYAFIGILGYILYIIAPANLLLFALGGGILSVFLAIYYTKRIEAFQKYGITSIITVLITYSLAPLLYTKPLWLTISVVTAVMTLIEMKGQLALISGKFENDDFIILSKFLVIAGVILPLLPHTPISEIIPISPFKFWMVVVVVSAVSYLSYILKKFIFPDKGMLVTGFLGGLYSSTATTVVLARKSKESDTSPHQVAASILLATGMMFIRIYALTLIFNIPLAKKLLVPFAILTVATLFISWLIARKNVSASHDPSPTENSTENKEQQEQKNPLEFKTALIFAGLFVLFSAITQYVLGNFGSQGLSILALIVGVTDIDPFLMSLFTGSYSVSLEHIASATLIAITSNNCVKWGYSIVLGDKNIRKLVGLGFASIILLSVVLIFLLF